MKFDDKLPKYVIERMMACSMFRKNFAYCRLFGLSEPVEEAATISGVGHAVEMPHVWAPHEPAPPVQQKIAQRNRAIQSFKLKTFDEVKLNELSCI